MSAYYALYLTFNTLTLLRSAFRQFPGVQWIRFARCSHHLEAEAVSLSEHTADKPLPCFYSANDWLKVQDSEVSKNKLTVRRQGDDEEADTAEDDSKEFHDDCF